MSYAFVDTNEMPSASGLPTEAVSINGSYIEELIEGYKTLYTSGRESLAVNLETYTVGSSDGEQIRYRNYPSRTIKVGFQLTAPTASEFLKRFNHLNNLLSLEEADFVFADEPDKYFTGTPIADISVDSGRLNVKGEWSIYCTYPFKRSNIIYEKTPTEYVSGGAKIAFEYKGTYPTRPLLIAKFAGAKVGGTSSEDGDCGFVAFLDNSGNIIQLGNPEALDFEEFRQARTLVNKEFVNLSGWTSGGNVFEKTAGNAANYGNFTDTNWNSGAGQTISCAKPIYGSGSGWHGSSMYATTEETEFFDIAAVHKLATSSKGTKEQGSFQIGAWGNGSKGWEMLAGISIDKTANGSKGTVYYIVDGKKVGSDSIDLSYNNLNFGYTSKKSTKTTQYFDKTTGTYYNKKAKGRTKVVRTNNVYSKPNCNTMISKKDGMVSFKVGSLATRNFATDNSLKASRVCFYFGANKKITPLGTNALHSLKFVATPNGLFTDIANVFGAGDIIEADCYDASITLRRANTLEGQLAPEYGALGNMWEQFLIERGQNEITVVWSDWVNTEYKPQVSVQYNEVYI